MKIKVREEWDTHEPKKKEMEFSDSARFSIVLPGGQELHFIPLHRGRVQVFWDDLRDVLAGPSLDVGSLVLCQGEEKP